MFSTHITLSERIKVLSMQQNVKWLLLSLGLLLIVVLGIILTFRVMPKKAVIPPCEAMRPSLHFRGTTYFAVTGKTLQSSDLGGVVATVGDGPEQAQSCMPVGTPIYAVKGASTASRLAANFNGILLFEPPSPTGVGRPPCEAMRPTLRYHGILYVAAIGTQVSPYDFGSVVTTVGNGSAQAQSCMPVGTPIYAVKGYPVTSRLAANFNGALLFDAILPTPSPTA